MHFGRKRVGCLRRHAKHNFFLSSSTPIPLTDPPLPLKAPPLSPLIPDERWLISSLWFYKIRSKNKKTKVVHRLKGWLGVHVQKFHRVFYSGVRAIVCISYCKVWKFAFSSIGCIPKLFWHNQIIEIIGSNDSDSTYEGLLWHGY